MALVKLFYGLIKDGQWTIERVPTLWRTDVQAMLDADKAKEAANEGSI